MPPSPSSCPRGGGFTTKCLRKGYRHVPEPCNENIIVKAAANLGNDKHHGRPARERIRLSCGEIVMQTRLIGIDVA